MCTCLYCCIVIIISTCRIRRHDRLFVLGGQSTIVQHFDHSVYLCFCQSFKAIIWNREYTNLSITNDNYKSLFVQQHTSDPYHSEIILKQAYNPIRYKKNNNREDTNLSITNNKLKSLFVLPHTPEPNYTEINLKQANPNLISPKYMYIIYYICIHNCKSHLLKYF